MIGTAHWCGTVNGMPALQLSMAGGADLWVYDDGWRKELHALSLADLTERMGLPWEDQPEHITLNSRCKKCGCVWQYESQPNILCPMCDPKGLAMEYKKEVERLKKVNHEKLF